MKSAVNTLILILTAILFFETTLFIIFMNSLFDEKWMRLIVVFVAMPMAVTPLVIQSLKGMADRSTSKNVKIPWILLVSLSITVIVLFKDFISSFNQTRSIAYSSLNSGVLMLVTSMAAASIVGIRSLFKYEKNPEKWMVIARIVLIIVMLFVLLRVYYPYFLMLLYSITENNDILNIVKRSAFSNYFSKLNISIIEWHINIIPSIYTQIVFFKKWWSNDAYGL